MNDSGEEHNANILATAFIRFCCVVIINLPLSRKYGIVNYEGGNTLAPYLVRTH
jgi:hypothetical protein